jgi:hypothetical protein
MSLENENRKLEQDLMKLMDEKHDTFQELLNDQNLTEERKEEIIERIQKEIEDYSKKYKEIIDKMGGTYTDPNIVLKESQIEKQIKDFEDLYGDKIKSIPVEEFLKSIHSGNIENNYKELDENGNIKSSDADPRTKQEAELTDFMDESLNNFDSLLKIEANDDGDKFVLKGSVADAIAIYESKFSEMSDKIEGGYRNPNILLKETEMKRKIEELKAKYDIDNKEEEIAKDETKNSDEKDIENIANESKENEGKFQINEYGEIIREGNESIRDDSVKIQKEDDTKDKSLEKDDNEKWNSRFQEWNQKVEEMPDGQIKKDEATKSIKDVKNRANMVEKNQEEQNKEEQEDFDFRNRPGSRNRW